MHYRSKQNLDTRCLPDNEQRMHRSLQEGHPLDRNMRLFFYHIHWYHSSRRLLLWKGVTRQLGCLQVGTLYVQVYSNGPSLRDYYLRTFRVHDCDEHDFKYFLLPSVLERLETMNIALSAIKCLL
jgi:hypothetical protein